LFFFPPAQFVSAFSFLFLVTFVIHFFTLAVNIASSNDTSKPLILPLIYITCIDENLPWAIQILFLVIVGEKNIYGNSRPVTDMKYMFKCSILRYPFSSFICFSYCLLEFHSFSRI
jgi:hypothetical protein